LLDPLPNKNVDTGMGLERTAAVLSGKTSVFELDVFQNMFSGLTDIAGVKYGAFEEQDRSMRIIADHLRAATFAIGDGVAPSNVQQGYVVRRLIRRAIREAHKLGVKEPFTEKIASIVIGEFGDFYTALILKREQILKELAQEETKFAETLEKGMKKLEEMLRESALTGEKAFILYSTYGFPIELTEEMIRERGEKVDRATFQAEFLKHQELSRTAAAGMFKGGLQDSSDECTRLHTATHLLHKALKNVLGDHVEQRGSNITKERLRLDFTHPTKMTPEEIKKVEDMVNGAIKRDLPVSFEEMDIDEARKSGAIGLFEEKYGNRVTVYTVGDFSKEICGGPHVAQTGELKHFKIAKEEASSAGVRRIKATVG